MLFKRIFKGKSMLNTADAKNKPPEKCSRRRSECDGCVEHSTILEETMKMVLLGVVLWAGVTFGSHVAPYPLNLIVSTDITHPPPMYDFPFPSADNLKRLRSVTFAQANKSLRFGKLSVDQLETFERNLHGAGIHPTQGSPAQGLLIDGYPSAEAMKYQKSSMIIADASMNLLWTHCGVYGLPNDECASYISTVNLRDTEFGGECAALERFSCRSNKLSSRYRTFDGSCNNPVRSSWGQTLTGYKRLLHPRYDDAISKPRRAHELHSALPSARVVSTSLTNTNDKPNEKRTIALAVWSQFVYNDLVHTPVARTIHTDESIRCCDPSGWEVAPRHQHPSCAAITVPSGDPHFGHNYVHCMEYIRSVTTYRGDCTFGAAEQMNQATHFLDGSHIYSTNGRDAASLREKAGGLLKTSDIDGEKLLPLVDNPLEKCLVNSSAEACFSSGDVRVNQHPWLTTLHTIFVREHNRVAKNLAEFNPGWNSDKLYHEARRIVVAELQHVTYRYWLPALTGKVFDELYDTYDTGYNSDIDPTITNSFATAAFHFFYSLLDEDIELVDQNNQKTTVKLGDNYYKPKLVTEKGAIEKLARSMANQKSQDMDLSYDNDLHNRWLGGLDVLAIDTQRGRDHGLPGYIQYRNLCGLSQATTFQHLTDVIPQETVDELSKLYKEPIDIDLVIGMMSERPLSNSMLGPTATCLIKEQLWRTRSGDRYFYSHTDETGSFSKRQLSELKRVTLSRMLCDNAGVSQIQRDAFQPPSDSNPIVPCEMIKNVNLEAWQEAPQRPDILTRTNKWIKEKVNSGNSTK